MNLSCSCSLDIEDILHYPFPSHSFPQHRTDIIKSIRSAFDNCESLSDNFKKDVILYGDLPLNENKKTTLAYMKNCERLSGFSNSLKF